MITIPQSLIHISVACFIIRLVLYVLQVHGLLAFLLVSTFGLGVSLSPRIFISAIEDFSVFLFVQCSQVLGDLYSRLYSRLKHPSLD